MWNPKHEIDTGIPLEKLKIKSGSWESSTLHRDMIVAHEWGVIPSLFQSLSEDDKALMISLILVKGDMETYEEEKRSKESRSSAPPAPKTPRPKKPRM
jgi:hypothetical protein